MSGARTHGASLRSVGPYLEAFDKFRLMALGRFGGDAAAPRIEAGYAASVIRYLKERAAELARPVDRSWADIGHATAETKLGAKIPAEASAELWQWAREICERADAEGMPFKAVTPNPINDHALLVKWHRANGGGGAPADPAPATDPLTATQADELEAEWGKAKPKPGPTPGDKFNTGLLLIAVIIIASLGHRAR